MGHRRQVLGGQSKGSDNKPADYKPTRFGGWDLHARDPLIWASAPDPAQLFERNKSEDPQKEGRATFLQTWHGAFESEPMLLRDVLRLSGHVCGNGPLSDFSDAVSDLAPLDRLTSKSLSKIVQRFANQWIGGYRIGKAPQSPKSKSSAKWVVEKKEED